MAFQIIGAAIGHAAGVQGCEQAPEIIHQQLPTLGVLWHQTIIAENTQQRDRIHDLAFFSQALAIATDQVLSNGDKFITFGGDHSCAVGTWSAVAQHHDDFGLIWIDAHMDAHTPETSPSGNPHGMPVASLLGYGDSRLTTILSKNPKIKPENIILIGIRSYEDGEAELLEKLGVKVLKIKTVKEQGFVNCMQDAYDYFEAKRLPFGISIDLDGLDPETISAVGTPVENGISLQSLTTALTRLNMPQVIGIEIVEYNPSLDNADCDGIQVIESILNSIPGFPPTRE